MCPAEVRLGGGCVAGLDGPAAFVVGSGAVGSSGSGWRGSISSKSGSSEGSPMNGSSGSVVPYVSTTVFLVNNIVEVELVPCPFWFVGDPKTFQICKGDESPLLAIDSSFGYDCISHVMRLCVRSCHFRVLASAPPVEVAVGRCLAQRAEGAQATRFQFGSEVDCVVACEHIISGQSDISALF